MPRPARENLISTAALRKSRRRDLQGLSLRVRVVTFALTLGLLSVVQIVVARPMLLAERFVTGAGWVEAAMLALYAAWLLGKIYDPLATPRWRRRSWLAFSLVFFAQLLLGLTAAERLLMTGKLHLPVPAMIVGGPLYRGDGLFMPILFLATILFVGPAWCSYLCYIGSWDLGAARARRRPLLLPRWRNGVRIALLAAVVTTALGLRALGVSGWRAALLGGGFGIVGVIVMLVLSRRRGVMVHCTVYCPIGLLADVLGKLSPFRLRILKEGCNDCAACAAVCRYDALRPEDIQARKPGLSCTLCGDCISSCAGRFIEYRWLSLSPRTARTAFLVVVISLHAVFLGVARL